MTLENYTHRLVALPPEATAYAAIRALEDNHIGAIVVQESGRILGIVTDRDLAIQIISFDQDPLEVRLGTVMSRPVQVISVDASPADAARMMRDRHVRRLPIVSGGKLCGMVTLDDLLADTAVDPALLSEIVRNQLGEPARLKFAGQRGPGAPVQRESARRVRGGTRARALRPRATSSNLASQLRREMASAFRRIAGG